MSKLVVKDPDEVETEYLQVVYAEVYAPNRLDSQNEYMTKDEIRKAAWKFMGDHKTRIIDMEHDNKIVEARVVESFIAHDDDPIFIPGSWVIGVHIEDAEIWDKVLKQELNGFSMEAWVIRDEKEVELDWPAMATGQTSTENGHYHIWYVKYAPDGKFMGGSTSESDGHVHLIRAGTVTEVAEGHSHKFWSVDELAIMPTAVLT